MDNLIPTLVILIAIWVLFATNRRKAVFRVLKKKREGVIKMSINMIQELIGKEVLLRDMILGASISGVITEIEEKWLKVEKTNRKGVKKVQIVTLDSIGSIQVIG